jgi:hypothetical protein
METTYFSETSVEFQRTTRRYIPEHKTACTLLDVYWFVGELTMLHRLSYVVCSEYSIVSNSFNKYYIFVNDD